MKKTWRGEEVFPPNDEEIKLVATFDEEIKLARYIDEMWVEENRNGWINVMYWMPIPILPNE